MTQILIKQMNKHVKIQNIICFVMCIEIYYNNLLNSVKIALFRCQIFTIHL